jgi:DNA-binding NarL/FixJ family response regulator
MKVRIIIADDHKIMRDGLRSLIEKEDDMTIIAEAENGRQAVKYTFEQQPDIIIMDLAMPDMNGIEATRQIIEKSQNTKVIALSMHSDRQFVAGMFKAGASGYLLKDCASDELIKAIRTIQLNRTYLSQDITGILVKEYVSISSRAEEYGLKELTDREREVLQLIAEGHSTKQIADKLFISIKTVEAHRANIMSKLDLHTLPELTKYAIRSGLTSLEH